MIYTRIKEKNSGLYVGFGDKSVNLVFDLFSAHAEKDIYLAANYAHAEVMCTLLNKITKLVYPNDDWVFVIEESKTWYPENMS